MFNRPAYLQITTSLVMLFLGLFVGFGLWRLAVGGRGEAPLKLAFVVDCCSAAFLFVLLAAAYVNFAGHIDEHLQALLPLMINWVPAALALVSSVLVVVGLLRSRLVPAWVAWLLGAAAHDVALSTVLFAPHDYAIFTHPTLAAVAAPVPAVFAWVARFSSVLRIAVPVVLGIALIGGVSNKRFEPTP